MGLKDRLKMAFWQLVRTGLVLVQFTVFGFLSWLYAIIVGVVGVLNLISVILGFGNFNNIDALFEPAWWLLHQAKVAIGAEDDFRPAPYV